MHDYEALHYDKEQLKEACEWQAGRGAGAEGRARAGVQPAADGRPALQLCRWALWWSQETATWSCAALTSRGSGR